MSRPPSPERDQAIAELRRLTKEHGVKAGVRLARKAYPDVPSPTWARWRLTAIGSVQQADSEAVAGLSAQVRESIPRPEHLAPALADPIPAQHRALTFWSMLDELESDARLLREFALTQSPDGQVKVRVPFALRDSHRMRCDILKLGLAQAEIAWSAERASAFYKAVVDAIGEESPSAQLRLMERLRRVQTEAAARGF